MTHHAYLCSPGNDVPIRPLVPCEGVTLPLVLKHRDHVSVAVEHDRGEGGVTALPGDDHEGIVGGHLTRVGWERVCVCVQGVRVGKGVCGCV